MIDISYGDAIDTGVGPLEFKIPSQTILVWRESSMPSAMFCEKKGDIPLQWLNSEYPLKILGEFKTIKKIIERFDLPPGSKVIDLSSDSIIYLSLESKELKFTGTRYKRVVVVDDSPTIRKLLSRLISNFEKWSVVAEVEDALKISKAIVDFYPDVVTLDLNLGAMNGAEAMKKFLAPQKIPTILITSQAIKDGNLVMEALSAGALDYLQKPESGKWDIMQDELITKLETALKAKFTLSSLKSNKLLNVPTYNYDSSKFIILIGSSTGGTQALQEIFTRLPANIPPILVTQHIPAGFSKALADRLNTMCPFEIKEAVSDDEIRIGRVLIAPGDHHLQLAKNGKKVLVVNDPPVNRFRPSVETMFSSFKDYKGLQIIAIMLTGMGKDGSLAMLELNKRGAITIAQDEESSVVFGMPKEAIRIGAAQHVKPLLDIPEFILALMSRKRQ